MGAFWNTRLGDLPPLLSRNTQPRPVEARASFLEDTRCRKERGHSETVASHPPTPFQPLHLRPQTREMRLHGSHRPDQPAGGPAGKCSQRATPGDSSRTVQPSHRSVRSTKSLLSKRMNEGVRRGRGLPAPAPWRPPAGEAGSTVRPAKWPGGVLYKAPRRACCVSKHDLRQSGRDPRPEGPPLHWV